MFPSPKRCVRTLVVLVVLSLPLTFVVAAVIAVTVNPWVVPQATTTPLDHEMPYASDFNWSPDNYLRVVRPGSRVLQLGRFSWWPTPYGGYTEEQARRWDRGGELFIREWVGPPALPGAQVATGWPRPAFAATWIPFDADQELVAMLDQSTHTTFSGTHAAATNPPTDGVEFGEWSWVVPAGVFRQHLDRGPIFVPAPRLIPLRPDPPAIAINALTYTTTLFAAWWVLATVRGVRRADRGRCPRCAYDLKHSFGEGCSECGWRRSVADSPNARATQN